MNRIKEIQDHSRQHECGEELKIIETQIHQLLLDEEIFWKQRSRANWLREGDKNTKNFHLKVSSRKRKNKIWGIENERGDWTEENEEVEKEFFGYFTKLFSTSNPTQAQMENALRGMMPKVTPEMNEYLCQPFIEEEITEALVQMCPTKAPGPDGLPAAFYRKHWTIVKQEVITTCLHILNTAGTIAPLNHTFIALIPKTAKPRKVTEFRPISLCNVIYRIVTKTMANRLKTILHTVINSSQSAFIPNRLITYNIIVGYECLRKN